MKLIKSRLPGWVIPKIRHYSTYRVLLFAGVLAITFMAAAFLVPGQIRSTS